MSFSVLAQLRQEVKTNKDLSLKIKKCNSERDLQHLLKEFNFDKFDPSILAGPQPVDLSDQELEMTFAGVSQGTTHCGVCPTVNNTACTNCFS